jgi:hypothetical protein
VSADKYRILGLWTDEDAPMHIVHERDRLHAEYIAASEAQMEAGERCFDQEGGLDRLYLANTRWDAARAALLKHIEEHP